MIADVLTFEIIVLALGSIMIACMLISGFFVLLFYKREKKKVFLEVDTMFHEKLQDALDSLGETFQEIFTEPGVKRAMSIIGSQGGEAKGSNALINEMANDVLNGPQFSAIQLGAEAMGLDIGGYIEKHGAAKTINAARQFAQLAGIDLMNFDLGSLSLPGPATSSGNVYLRR